MILSAHDNESINHHGANKNGRPGYPHPHPMLSPQERNALILNLRTNHKTTSQRRVTFNDFHFRFFSGTTIMPAQLSPRLFSQLWKKNRLLTVSFGFLTFFFRNLFNFFVNMGGKKTGEMRLVMWSIFFHLKIFRTNNDPSVDFLLFFLGGPNHNLGRLLFEGLFGGVFSSYSTAPYHPPPIILPRPG